MKSTATWSIQKETAFQERDWKEIHMSLAFCSHQLEGKAVSFAGLIGLMRFPYSSLRACQPSRLHCHFPLLTADPLCKRRREGGVGVWRPQLVTVTILSASMLQGGQDRRRPNIEGGMGVAYRYLLEPVPAHYLCCSPLFFSPFNLIQKKHSHSVSAAYRQPFSVWKGPTARHNSLIRRKQHPRKCLPFPMWNVPHDF